MVNLTHRSVEKEVMDDFGLPSAEIDPVLQGLGQMNKLFGGHKAIIKALKKVPLQNGDVIADWGCGGGDMLIAIADWAQKNNINIKLQGIDAAPAAIKFAQQQSVTYNNISYRLADVLVDEFNEAICDYVICNLFSHHFTNDEWIKLVTGMKFAAKKAVIINDLHRHRVLYYAVIAITRLFTSNKMVRIDGPLSVKKSFKRRELVDLLNRAGIKNYSLRWLWPFRWQIVIYKS
ncbi:methyltransferase domain-containing protein [Mucilaginibacter ginkgonis]|uniref:Methyltransferase domain-containing protein n=1 Tax=Mucilaginibacter ginkgonis TaxID=2682091 RepID=A0A6I4HYN0_9SPHI|nr:methyltransferase domain-containing protein [Mucilaginibacter ginkgonis]QQL49571.1 methyltransferase domain-containing protein [Mucilaginibacter ginkgonis]